MKEDTDLEIMADRPYSHLQAILRGRQLVILGSPHDLKPLRPDDKEVHGHNCDAMGCGQCHVLFRVFLPSEPAEVTRPLSEWREDDGPALWWTEGEPPYCGTPLDSDWPGDEEFFGWTPLPRIQP